MRLTTKGRYAVTAMLDLALHASDGPICLSDISARQSISLSYLEQLFSKLRQKALVQSIRGPGGGYQLAKAPCQLYVSDIVGAVSETIDATNCSGGGACQSGDMCLTHHLWDDLSQQIHQFLSSISLQSLIERDEVKQISQRQSAQHQVLQNLEIRSS